MTQIPAKSLGFRADVFCAPQPPLPPHAPQRELRQRADRPMRGQGRAPDFASANIGAQVGQSDSRSSEPKAKRNVATTAAPEPETLKASANIGAGCTS